MIDIKCHTKTALILLMVYIIIAIVTNIVTYGLYFSFDFETISAENISSFLMMIPLAFLGLAGGIIGLIGAILMLMGRNEFGEKHRKFMFYAIIVFVVMIVGTIIFTIFVAFMVYSSITTMASTTDVTEVFSSGFMATTFIYTAIMAIIGALIWVFALYQLENKKGRMVLFAAYAMMVATAIIVSVSSIIYFNEFISSGAFEDLISSDSFSSSSAYSQLLTSSQWIGTTAIFNIIGNIVGSTLLLVALYIPYERITSGELVSIQPVTVTTAQSSHRRECPNCGRTIPFDANTCPYCGKQFKSYL